MYKQDRERELSDATLQSHGYRFERFLEWCGIADIDNLNSVTERDLHWFQLFRKAQMNDVPLESQMDTLRVFIRLFDGTACDPSNQRDCIAARAKNRP